VILLLARPAASVRPVLVPQFAATTLGDQFETVIIPYIALAYLLPREVAQFSIPRFIRGPYKLDVYQEELSPPEKFWFSNLADLADVRQNETLLCSSNQSVGFDGNITGIIEQLEEIRDRSIATVCVTVILKVMGRKDPRGVRDPLQHLFQSANRSVTHDFMGRGLRSLAPTVWAWKSFKGTRKFAVQEMAFVFIRYDKYACDLRGSGPQGERVCLPKYDGRITSKARAALGSCQVRPDEKKMCMVDGRAYVDSLLEIGSSFGIRQFVISVKPGSAGRAMENMLLSLPNSTRALHSAPMPNWANFLNMELAYRAKLMFLDPGSLWGDWPMMRRNAEQKPVVLTTALSPTQVKFTQADHVCLRARAKCRLLPK